MDINSIAKVRELLNELSVLEEIKNDKFYGKFLYNYLGKHSYINIDIPDSIKKEFINSINKRIVNIKEELTRL